MVNKIDIPAVRDNLPQLLKDLKSIAGHKRVLGISAATGENVKMLMSRVNKLITDLDDSSKKGENMSPLFASQIEDLLTEDVERVNLDDEDDVSKDTSFEIYTDDAFPGQFRVCGRRIERIVTMTNFDYYEALQRFQRILEAEGISAALKERGAVDGDLVMIGDWDFNYYDRRTRWVSELGLENINPRRRFEQVE